MLQLDLSCRLDEQKLSQPQNAQWRERITETVPLCYSAGTLHDCVWRDQHQEGLSQRLCLFGLEITAMVPQRVSCRWQRSVNILGTWDRQTCSSIYLQAQEKLLVLFLRLSVAWRHLFLRRLQLRGREQHCVSVSAEQVCAHFQESRVFGELSLSCKSDYWVVQWQYHYHHLGRTEWPVAASFQG